MKEQVVANANPQKVPLSAAVLGYAGALPFVAAALSCILLPAPYSAQAQHMLLAYGAIILSFMGGIHWGFALLRRDPPDAAYLAASVVPALVGWLSLLIAAKAGLIVLAAAFGLLLVFDFVTTARAIAPPWYPSLRAPLTFFVIASLLTALLR